MQVLKKGSDLSTSSAHNLRQLYELYGQSQERLAFYKRSSGLHVFGYPPHVFHHDEPGRNYLLA